MSEHKHPLDLIDLWLEQLHHEEECEEDEEAEDASLIAKQQFHCLCFLCEEEIKWFHRYYYTCQQCDYSIHKFCAKLPPRLEDTCHAHTLYFLQPSDDWRCTICHKRHNSNYFSYHCSQCNFNVDVNCATKFLQKNIVHHPSHKHPLACLTKHIICECDACGKKHAGTFYHCNICEGPFVHNDCVFLPEKLQIQHYTNNYFSHTHHLTLAYSFSRADQESKFFPRCRVCSKGFYKTSNLWIYKCEKCRYYTHLDCITPRNEPFMSILGYPGTGRTIKNYVDLEHPDLVHLPFPNTSYSILKHLFFKKNISTTTFEINISHQHPLILEDVECTDVTSPTLSRIKSISYHDPMKSIQLLCNGCLRPIMSGPIYVCANYEDEDCNFVLHKWCSRLPCELKDHFAHPQHTLVLHSKSPNKFFGVFRCDICGLSCNGFVYCCEKCKYYIDVNCAFLPKEITHASHPNHLLSRVGNGLDFVCHICNFYINSNRALLIPETTSHKCDKHPMKLSYFPIENHKSEYFCEICEKEFDPEFTFYHCDKCMQSVHTACAPSILRYETHTGDCYSRYVYRFVNVKFGGTYNNNKVHPHPLSFVQGIARDGECNRCGSRLQYEMIFKCRLNCKFAVDIFCCELLSK
ncbi:hypothetical protein SSX86_012964 [Deinandra increscens subsp. villosa]|uniref:PHD-type domain-containing protein n=1 Tax=Deinandra increscens subsp. villosa TaxID=3103831 RepID=A0AAP0GZA9_9ASTR